MVIALEPCSVNPSWTKLRCSEFIRLPRESEGRVLFSKLAVCDKHVAVTIEVHHFLFGDKQKRSKSTFFTALLDDVFDNSGHPSPGQLRDLLGRILQNPHAFQRKRINGFLVVGHSCPVVHSSFITLKNECIYLCTDTAGLTRLWQWSASQNLWIFMNFFPLCSAQYPSSVENLSVIQEAVLPGHSPDENRDESSVSDTYIFRLIWVEHKVGQLGSPDYKECVDVCTRQLHVHLRCSTDAEDMSSIVVGYAVKLEQNLKGNVRIFDSIGGAWIVNTTGSIASWFDFVTVENRCINLTARQIGKSENINEITDEANYVFTVQKSTGALLVLSKTNSELIFVLPGQRTPNSILKIGATFKNAEKIYASQKVLLVLFKNSRKLTGYDIRDGTPLGEVALSKSGKFDGAYEVVDARMCCTGVSLTVGKYQFVVMTPEQIFGVKKVEPLVPIPNCIGPSLSIMELNNQINHSESKLLQVITRVRNQFDKSPAIRTSLINEASRKFGKLSTGVPISILSALLGCGNSTDVPNLDNIQVSNFRDALLSSVARNESFLDGSMQNKSFREGINILNSLKDLNTVDLVYHNVLHQWLSVSQNEDYSNTTEVKNHSSLSNNTAFLGTFDVALLASKCEQACNIRDLKDNFFTTIFGVNYPERDESRTEGSPKRESLAKPVLDPRVLFICSVDGALELACCSLFRFAPLRLLYLLNHIALHRKFGIYDSTADDEVCNSKLINIKSASIENDIYQRAFLSLPGFKHDTTDQRKTRIAIMLSAERYVEAVRLLLSADSNEEGWKVSLGVLAQLYRRIDHTRAIADDYIISLYRQQHRIVFDELLLHAIISDSLQYLHQIMENRADNLNPKSVLELVKNSNVFGKSVSNSMTANTFRNCLLILASERHKSDTNDFVLKNRSSGPPDSLSR